MAGISIEPFTKRPKDKIVCSNDVLGSSSSDTIVYKGTFGKRPVAVKLLTGIENRKRAETEMDILISFDSHLNIVRYVAFEEQDAGFILALELCHSSTLADWVKDRKCIPIKIKKLDVLKQCTEGLAFLHRNGVIHRNLKPSKILFHGNSKSITVKIADFGVSRVLDPDKSSKTLTSTGGTTGWKAAEVLEAEEKLGDLTKANVPKITRKADIFSLGCIYFYVLSKGKHPFGSNSRMYDQNILDDKAHFLDSYPNLRLNCNLTLIKNLVSKIPWNRPDAESVLCHPIFWSYEKMLNFIVDISNFVNEYYRNLKKDAYNETALDKEKQGCLAKLELTTFAENIKGQPLGWFNSIDVELKEILLQNDLDKNQYHTVTKLIRLIRNFNNHYHEKTFDQDIKAHVGEIPNAFMKYWLKCFPELVNEVRSSFDPLKNESLLRKYY